MFGMPATRYWMLATFQCFNALVPPTARCGAGEQGDDDGEADRHLAAATVMMKNTKMLPSIVPLKREKATAARVEALSISSRHR